MSFRNQKYGVSFDHLRSQGQSRDSVQNLHNTDNLRQRPIFDSYMQKKPENSSSPYSHPLRSPSQEEAYRIEQRHEELKRQIALKEKQLADMTGERDTVNALRSKLGLKNLNPDDSKLSISQSRRNIPNAESRRGNLLSSSISPDHSMPSMVGLKSTTYGRGVSFERMDPRKRFQAEEEPYGRDKLESKYASQQLQFHPTRIPAAVRRVHPASKNSSSSPLRNKSSNQDDNSIKNYHSLPRFNEYGDAQRRSVGRSKGSNSPLRSRTHQTSAIIEEPVESSDNYNEESSRFNMQRVDPGMSGRPAMTQSIPLNAREKLYRERIEAMTLDNQSLQRRLNQVTNELDRIQRENEAIVRQIEMAVGDVNRFNDLINNKDDVDAQNNILQQDLERIKVANLELNQNLRDEEVKTQDATNKLGLASANVKSQEIDCDTMNHELRQKIQRFDAISRERAMNIQKLNSVNVEIEKLNRDELSINHENIDLEANVARLQQERRELLGKIERLTQNYDGTVKDLSYGKRNMDRDNAWHTKLIVTKNMHVALDFMVRRRRQIIFNEVVNYSVFDSICHQKLRNLANTLDKVGKYKQMIGLHQWYDRALRPYGTRLQNDDLTIVQSCQNLTDRVFYAWKQYVFEKQEIYHFKQNAIQQIWYRMITDSKKEMKRAFEIWKQKKRSEKGTTGVIKRVAKKFNQRRMEQAFNSWIRYSQELEYHCRIQLLYKDFIKKRYLQQVFGEFRVCIRIQKQNRIRIQNQYLKAWKDYMIYNRHLMQSNMASIAFRNQNSEYTLRACFQALRNYTEKNKYTLLKYAVQEDMDVVIAETSAFNQNSQNKLLTKNQRRAGNITRDILGKRLFSYFKKWKDETWHYQNTMDLNVKNKILKVYVTLMGSYFNHWKNNIFTKQRLAKMKIVQELQMSSEAMTNEALTQERELRQKVEGVKSIQRRVTEKTFKKLFFRKLQYAINRWKDICVDKNDKEARAAFLCKRLRQRLLRQAFDRYLWFLKKSLQHSKNERRADHIQETLRMRSLRKSYNAMITYTKWRRRVTRVWHKVLYRFDYFQKMRAIKRWKHNAHDKFEGNLKNNQHELTNFVHDQENELNEFHLNNHGQTNHILQKEKEMRRKGYRQIGNMFQRLYTDQTQQKFNIWKQKVLVQKQKEKIMRRSIEHYERRYKQAIHQAFLKFLSDDRRRERLEQIKQTEIESHDIQLIINQNRDQHHQLKAQQGSVQLETTCVSEETERKVLHTMECMAKRNLNWVYRSRKRMIFEMWRTVCKEEKAFAYSVRNVIMKSILQDGFARIKHQARDIDFTQKVHRVLIRYSLKGGHIKMGDSFTRWKKFAFSKVDTKTLELHAELQRKVQDFEAFRNATQERNFQRVTSFFIEKNSQNIFKAWRNVILHMKLVKSKTVEFHSRQHKLQRKWAIQTWKCRVDKTVQYNQQIKLMKEAYQQLYLKQCFRAMKHRFNTTRSLSASLSHLEYALRTKMVGGAFRTIQSYSNSKKLVKWKNAQVGAIQTSRIFKDLYNKQLGLAFNKYRAQCYIGEEGQATFKSVFGKVVSKRLRDAFNWWKKKHEMCELAQECHETGPVRAEHWLAEKEIANMQQFMRDQHYTELEINKFYNDVCDENERLMRKYMIRMKYKMDPNKKLLYQTLDRWKGFVHIRKNVKYQFQFIANFKENQKAEMQIAFNKWRRGNDKLEEQLWRLDYNTLEAIAYRTTMELKECGESIAENQSINNHLVLQRDEFLNYYIKGQILAMALVRDRTEFAKMQGISRWLILYRKWWVQNMKQNIRDDEYLLANLEQRQEFLEGHNAEMVEENAEMEQFKQDGEIIRANKHRLNEDVEELKDQLDNLEEEMKKLQEQKFELQVLLDAENDKIKENKQKGYIPKFEQEHKKAQLKSQPNHSQSIIVDENETEEEKKMRLKMEELKNLSKVGPALR